MSDAINPSHYKDGFSNGAEVIDIVENLTYNRGAAVKYLARAGKKAIADELEDLKKAKWYIEREIKRVRIERGYASKTLDTTINIRTFDPHAVEQRIAQEAAQYVR
ncbi:DUF3310 domain-containing protein [Mycobacteroides abscessus]|uniref:DUF3310 domain-containing protein n=1 Tax=Mycobacteroides abscessus TaxID=36809 RepID=UPI0009A828C0|nr:DUF3310 domain-containing protein [Mycobacteroides abscessus]UVK63472.1 hypothetical protein SEA_BAUDELAIRE_100 [Mycobacterium phage Baudelaire]WKW86592.1 hypothetical protein SEA_AEGEUS_100 [Mycobacterium phage Aegeus]SKT46115.1 Protein of unknwon function (DUF3310) [Mycobacteroides abscessus subsp. bolletii]